MQRNTKRPKGIIIVGAGAVGSKIAQITMQRDWNICCVANRAGEKVGRGFGELSSYGELNGIIVSNIETIDFASLNAEIAIVAVSDRLRYNEPIHRKLMEAGLNVICLGTESSFPWAVDKQLASEYDEIAKNKNITFIGCGFWDAYRISTLKTLVGPCTSLRKISHKSVTNADRFGEEVMRAANIGNEIQVINQTGVKDNTTEYSIYRTLMPQVVTAIGLTIEDITERNEAVVHDKSIFSTTLNKTIRAGDCIGTRSIIEVATKEGVCAIAEIELRLIEEGENEGMSWDVDGDPPAQMKLQGLDSGHATASSVVNRILDVINAPSGIATVDQLPPMKYFSRH